ncbi:MAG: sugar phosphate isomerase/epimerase family protein [Bryobacteraceae bacterium]
MFRHAICNDIFQGRALGDAVRAAKQAGYMGLEFAAFTLGEDPAALEAARRREVRATLEGEGIGYVGLHWLLATPKALHITTPDAAQRRWSWDYVRRLVDLSADLGPDSVMVFGSPRQRSSIGGLSRQEATRHFVDGLAAVAGHACERGVTILVEALSPDQTDVVTTLDEAAAIVREIDSPAVKTIFDSHNAAAEKEPHAVLVDRHFDLIRHVHVNELDGKHPGCGDYDFLPVLEVLHRRGDAGWISVETFDCSFGAEQVMAESMERMRAVIGRIA